MPPPPIALPCCGCSPTIFLPYRLPLWAPALVFAANSVISLRRAKAEGLARPNVSWLTGWCSPLDHPMIVVLVIRIWSSVAVMTLNE